METPTIDIARLRGMLAEHRIRHTEFARACGLNPRYISSLLCGRPAGELALLKMAKGMRALGLESEATRADN